MIFKRKDKKPPTGTLNIWNSHGFDMAGLGEKFKITAKVKHFFRCIEWSLQRVSRGYSDSDVWNLYDHLQKLIPDMLQHLKDNRMGSPGFLGENYYDEKGILVNDTCHAEWDKILDKMIFLWRETDEDTCSKKNPYEEEYMNAFTEFDEKYGLFGEGLQTDEEREESKRSGSSRVHFMNELPEYKEISEKHREEDERLDKYRNNCKDEALDMLKEYFFALWD